MRRKELGSKEIMALVRGFQPSCVVVAGAELDIFTILDQKPMNVTQLARKIKGDERATCILLDALAAMRLLDKGVEAKPVYSVPVAVAEVLTETGSKCMLGMVRHLGNCLRGWGQLGSVVLGGRRAKRHASIRGKEGDLNSFIRAMHEISAPMAMPLIRSLGALKFAHLLDIGGASGSWTVPFLHLNPKACATIFDRPDVVPMARRLIKKVGLSGRVQFVAGNYNKDKLPYGSDMAWVSAIVHQNSRVQNRAMFKRVFSALVPGGRILIRDIIMDETRTKPEGGALFAINMLVATPSGGTFTFNELSEDLKSAGFSGVKSVRTGEWMDSVISACKDK